MWHYRLGIFTIVIALGHILKRKRLLLKWRGK